MSAVHSSCFEKHLYLIAQLCTPIYPKTYTYLPNNLYLFGTIAVRGIAPDSNR